MSVTDTTVPYEILLRFAPDGSFQGAHQQRRRIVTLDGEVIKDDVLPAEPLGTSDFPASLVMTETTSAAIAAANSARDRAADLEMELILLRAENAALAASLAAASPAPAEPVDTNI